MQETNEHRFSRKFINKYIEESITKYHQDKVDKGVQLLNEWLEHWLAPWTDQCESEKHHTTKSGRLSQLSDLNVEQLVMDVMVTIAYYWTPTLFVSVTAQLATRLGFDDRKDSIQTIAEMVTVLCYADAYNITKETRESSLMVANALSLPSELLEAMERSQYLPPMVCKPQILESNYESGYLTHNDSLVLGKDNGHAGDLCLDVINLQNQTALSLDLEFLSSVEEQPNPSKPLDTLDKQHLWNRMKETSYAIYSLLAQQGNQFWLTHKPDKRGRLYAQGYHVTTQGTSFKKASIELHHQEIVEGVPT